MSAYFLSLALALGLVSAYSAESNAASTPPPAQAPPSPPAAAPAATHQHAPDGAEHTAEPFSGICSMDVFSHGKRLHLLTGRMASDAAHPVLEYHYSDDGGQIWSIPSEVNRDMPVPQGLRRGMDAQIVATDDYILVTWMIPGTGLFKSGPMFAVVSTNGGVTWTPVGNPSQYSTSDGRGFADLNFDKNGHAEMVWLENANGKRGLAYAKTADRGATWYNHRRLDDETCECCWNTIAKGPEGQTAVLYRDRSPREMKVTVSSDEGKTWSSPEFIGNMNWHFEGCPHVGGSLTFHQGPNKESALSAVQWTGAKDVRGVYYSRKSFADQSWTPATRLGGFTAVRPDIASDGKQRVVVAWDQQTHGSTTILAVESVDGGQTFSPFKRISNIRCGATQPRVIFHQGEFHFFWTENADHGRKVWRHRKGWSS